MKITKLLECYNKWNAKMREDNPQRDSTYTKSKAQGQYIERVLSIHLISKQPGATPRTPLRQEDSIVARKQINKSHCSQFHVCLFVVVYVVYMTENAHPFSKSRVAPSKDINKEKQEVAC